MTATPGRPGHGQNLSIRLQPAAMKDGPFGSRLVEAVTGMYEIICPDCGDNGVLPYDQVTPELQKVRGPYPSEDAAMRASGAHMGGVVWRG
jgi:hypothetical protein